jgi:hypothetical protein
MNKQIKEGLHFLTFNLLSNGKNILHAVTTRTRGVSVAPFDSLNLGWNVGDVKENVIRNYQLLSSALGLELGSLVTCKQVHGDRIIEVNQEYNGRGLFPHYREAADAMITNVSGLVLIIRIADCIPVLFYDPVQKAVGIAHAGWRGTLKKIAAKTVELLIDRYNSNPANILVGIGPGIGPCCYEVDGKVRSLYEENISSGGRLFEEREGKIYLNIWEANRSQLLDIGIKEKNIELAGLCTSCNPQTFFSHRRDKGRTGRFAALIGLKE